MMVKAGGRSAGLSLDSTALRRPALVLILLAYLALGALSVKGKTATFDEPRHYRYGMNILNGNSSRFDDSKMPLSALNALPAFIAGRFPPGALQDLLSDFFTARMMTLAVSALVALLVFRWSQTLYGTVPAFASLLLYVFDPNILAHAQLVTTDLYALGSIALACFCLWRFAHRRTLTNGLLCALALGLSQIAKYSSLALYPLACAALLLFDLPAVLAARRAGSPGAIQRFLRQQVIYVSVALTVSLAVINLAFLFNQSFTRFGDYRFRSDLFRSLQTDQPALANLPVPVPYPYLEGLDWVLQREQTGQGYGRIYLLGQLRDGQGFMGYYLFASLLKVPLATQVLLVAALGAYWLNAERRKTFLANEIFLLLPVAFYVLYFNFFFDAQLGIRYYLVIFPLLYVFVGGLFAGWAEFPRARKTVALGALAWLVLSVLAYFPYYLTYFNELVWDKTQTYKYLADSNLDWGQSKPELERYFADHPDAAPPPAAPHSGHFAIAANRLVGITAEPERFRWLRENFEPVGTVANCYFVYKISSEEVERLCATTSYCAAQ